MLQGSCLYVRFYFITEAHCRPAVTELLVTRLVKLSILTSFSTFVTEWRAEVIEHQNGKRYVAQFPEDVTRPIQYSAGVKSNAVYMSQYQLIPYNRVEEQFQDQRGIPISAGTINNFNKVAFEGDVEFLWMANKKSVLSPEYFDKDNSHLLLKRLYLRNNVHIDGRHGFFS